MNFTFEKKAHSDLSETYILTLDLLDLVKVTLNEYDRWLIKEYHESGKISDKLLSLAHIVKKIETKSLKGDN